MALSPDRKQQVETTKRLHGEDHYKKMGSKGGANNRKNLTSEHQRRAAKARWDKYRAEQSKKEGKNDG